MDSKKSEGFFSTNEIMKSEEFKNYFLAEFTTELIRNSKNEVFFELKKIMDEEEKEKPLEKIEDKKFDSDVQPEEVPKGNVYLNQGYLPSIKSLPPQKLIKMPLAPAIRMSAPRLPPRLNYLRPTPRKLALDLGALNPILKDPFVTSIECDGEGKSLIAKTKTGAKKINIKLYKDQINEILNKFSKGARIPLIEGTLKIVLGSLILSAIYSTDISSRFIIRKMAFNPALIQSNKLNQQIFPR